MSLPQPLTLRRLGVLAALLAVAAVALALVPELALAQGNPLERGASRAESTARTVGGAVFAILLIVGVLRLFAQRNFGGLAVLVLVGGIVGWLIADPGAPSTIQDIGSAIFG